MERPVHTQREADGEQEAAEGEQWREEPRLVMPCSMVSMILRSVWEEQSSR